MPGRLLVMLCVWMSASISSPKLVPIQTRLPSSSTLTPGRKMTAVPFMPSPMARLIQSSPSCTLHARV